MLTENPSATAPALLYLLHQCRRPRSLFLREGVITHFVKGGAPQAGGFALKQYLP